MLLRLIWDTVKKIYFQCLINYMYNQHFYFYFPPVWMELLPSLTQNMRLPFLWRIHGMMS